MVHLQQKFVFKLLKDVYSDSTDTDCICLNRGAESVEIETPKASLR